MVEELLRTAPEPVAAEHEPAAGVSVYVWLGDAALLAEVGRRCLHLDCDRLEVAPIEQAEQGSQANQTSQTNQTKQATLVRIDSPPHYVVEWCRSQPADEVQVFVAMDRVPGVFIEWGFAHPLASLLRRQWDVERDGWLFFAPNHPGKTQRRVSPPKQWRSIYEALDLHIDVDAEQDWQLSNEAVEPFRVALRMTPRLRSAEPEFVLAGPQDTPAVEELLAHADPELLEQIEVSVQEKGGGQTYFLFRDRRARNELRLERFPGRRFCRFRGLERLLVPVDQTLRPPLRRDRYRELFDLSRGELTLVVPADGPADRAKQVRIFRVKEASFVPFSMLVEHFVGFEQEALEALLVRTSFHLGPYKLAPSRPDLLRKNESTSYDGTPRDDLGEPSEPQEQEEAEPELPDLQPPSSLGDGERRERDEEPLVGLEAQARRLERELIIEGPSGPRWEALGEVQRRLGSADDAAFCALEALWHASVGEVFGSPTSQWRSIDELQRQLLERIQAASLEDWLPGVSAIEHVVDGAEPSRWLVAVDKGLRDGADELPLKLRWLAWREVLSHNRDVRTYQEQRDSLLERLNEHGLRLGDTAPCIRERIIQEPSLEEALDADRGEAVGAQENLATVGAFFVERADERLRPAACASAARIAARFEWEQAVESYLKHAGQTLDAGLDELVGAWTQLMGAQVADGEQAQALLDDFEQTLERLPSSCRGALRELRERLERQAESDEARLVESPRRLFPANALDGEYREMVERLEQAHWQADVEAVFEQANALLEQITEKMQPDSDEQVDLRTAAEVIRRTVEVLRRHQWDAEHSPIDVIEPFVDALLNQPEDRHGFLLYYAVARFAAARALLDLGRDERALTIANQTLDWLASRRLPALDFVDAIRSEALMVVELAPPERRNQTLRHLLRAVEAQHDTTIPPVVSARDALVWLEMLDQVAESAVSKTRYAHRRLREWQEREEFMIRQVLQMDRPHEEDR